MLLLLRLAPSMLCTSAMTVPSTLLLESSHQCVPAGHKYVPGECKQWDTARTVAPGDNPHPTASEC
jgi:hypothetical protein